MSSEALEPKVAQIQEAYLDDAYGSSFQLKVAAYWPEIMARLAEVARLEQERGEKAAGWRDCRRWNTRVVAALVVAREREQRATDALHEIADRHPDASIGEHPAVDIARRALVGAPGNTRAREQRLTRVLTDIEAELRFRASDTNAMGQVVPPYTAHSLLSMADEARAALADEPAAAGAGHNLCACGATLIVCDRCGDSRCLVCDPYDERDTCGATEPAAATLAEPEGVTGPVEASAIRQSPDPGSASAAADEPGETPA